MSRLTLLSGTAIAFVFLPGALSAREAQPASEEETAGPAATVEEPEATNGQSSDEAMDEYGGEDIVVMGQKPRGSVVGDIPPT